jgi:hypothetical protein
MKQLNAVLKHDDGRLEEVSTTFLGEWGDAFDHLLQVYCRTNTVEMLPVSITCPLSDLVFERYDAEMCEMVWVEEV